MRQRMWLALVGGGILAGVALTTAQRFQSTAPDSSRGRVTHADGIRASGGQITLNGNVRIQVDGVTLLADRAVIQGTEVTLEGNVRATLAKPTSIAAEMRDRIPTPRIPTGPQ